jgi:hypothetical protein
VRECHDGSVEFATAGPQCRATGDAPSVQGLRACARRVLTLSTTMLEQEAGNWAWLEVQQAATRMLAQIDAATGESGADGALGAAPSVEAGAAGRHE